MTPDTIDAIDGAADAMKAVSALMLNMATSAAPIDPESLRPLRAYLDGARADLLAAREKEAQAC